MKWLITFFIVITAGWMLFDGSRALIVGDYITPSSGEFAGQLGPWSMLVQVIGIDPRSTLMKIIFIAYGFITFIALFGFLKNKTWGHTMLMAMAILGLWYLPIGTLVNLIVLILLVFNKK